MFYHLWNCELHILYLVVVHSAVMRLFALFQIYIFFLDKLRPNTSVILIC
jgi:hypothetical protein